MPARVERLDFCFDRLDSSKCGANIGRRLPVEIRRGDACLQRALGSPTGREGEAWDVLSQLPKDLKGLWLDASVRSAHPHPSMRI